MIHECINPVPVHTPLGDGYIFYIKPNGFLENDEVTVVLLKGGHIKHFTTDQIRVWHNATYTIEKESELPF